MGYIDDLRGTTAHANIIKEVQQPIDGVQPGTVATNQVQRHGRESGSQLLNVLLDTDWIEPLPMYAYIIEHPERSSR
jgi:hypothetical protein